MLKKVTFPRVWMGVVTITRWFLQVLLPLPGPHLGATRWRTGSTQRTRHFERSETMFKRYYMLMLVHPHLVSTVDMVADIFTKALDRDKFYKFRNALLNIENGPHELDAMNGLAARAWAKLQRHMFSP